MTEKVVRKNFYLFIVGLLLAAGCNFTTSKSLPARQISAPTGKDQSTTIPAPALPKYSAASGRRPQFVVLAFDGSRSLPMWQETLDFAQEMNRDNKPLHFTYFLSGVYFLNYRKASRYQPPKESAGTSRIGFADSNKDVERRVAFVNRAISENHEIGSHLNGHFDGTRWQLNDWRQEFDQFNNLIFNIAGNNDVSNKDAGRYQINLPSSGIVGLRAPDLGRNKALFQVLQENHYVYDASGVGQANEWPSKTDNGIWEFPLAQIQYASTTGKILSMDYNFYFKQSGARDTAKKNTALWQKFYDITYSSYLNYFNGNFAGSRAPVFIGSHFSEWNDGVYWAAMKDFAFAVCGKPEVYCVTYGELQKYMEAK